MAKSVEDRGRGARLARRDEGAYLQYVTEEQRSQPGWIGLEIDRLGHSRALNAEAVYALFKTVHKQFPKKDAGERTAVNQENDVEETEAPEPEAEDYRARLLAVLRSLPSAGFERICQRLLRESGFQQVVVTGRSGDSGIDGHGVLEVNPLVTFKVLFQCKRYSDRAVTPSQVRDFRGAMQGRADKGLILTTGGFTSDARKEATRNGVPPIELVDSEKLVAMFARVEVGLRPVQTFRIGRAFLRRISPLTHKTKVGL